MSLELVFFYLYAVIAVAGAIGLLIARSPVHAVMSLFVTLLAVAALYLLLGSEFLAAMQLFVYGGAITVLVLFVLMLSRPSPSRVDNPTPVGRWVATAAVATLFGVIAAALGATSLPLSTAKPPDTATLAELLFSRYVLPFEVAGLLLTVAVVGALVLSRRDRATTDSEVGDGISRPGTTSAGGDAR